MTECLPRPVVAQGNAPRTVRCSAGGTTVSARSWGHRASPTVVLLHGGAAHSGWWDYVVSFLVEDFHVLAPDLSGHGDSDWRASYGLAVWSDEVAAVVEEHASPRPVVVGHSMGGHVALCLAQRAGATLAGLVTVDSEIRSRDAPPRPRPWSSSEPGDRAVYPDEATILSRFRTMPEGCHASPEVLRDIARQSIVRHGGGWSWKFDRRFADHDPLRMEDLAPLPCPVRVVRAEHGLVDDTMAIAAAARLQPSLPSAVLATACVSGAGHHIPLEEPRELASIISATAPWRLQAPPRQPEDR